MNLSSLNKEQREAVTAPLGPVLVLAGAGSGKTRVLTYRIAYLIEQGLFKPWQILAVTFTNKAAKEMQNRVSSLLSSQNSETKTQGAPVMGTFHSLGARMLRADIIALGYSRDFTIIDDGDQLSLYKEILKQEEVSSDYTANFFRGVISRAKNYLQTPESLNQSLDPRVEQIVRNIYVKYQNRLHRENLVDFDDLLMLPVKIFESRPEILNKYRERHKYVLVDEYQDTNHVQYVWLRMLAGEGNVFVVGDDAQSIYGFRGSIVRNILDFERDFPGSHIYKLEQNYRSTGHILKSAQAVINLNVGQHKKELWTENGDGAQVRVEELENERTEAAFVTNTIVKMVSGEEGDVLEYEEEEEVKPFSILDQFLKASKKTIGGGFGMLKVLPLVHEPLNEIAVLFRTHAQSRALEEAFIGASVPYQIIGGVKFYERKEIKDVLAYLRLLLNVRDSVSLKRVINVPARGIGDKSYEVVRSYIEYLANEDSELDVSSVSQKIDLVKLSAKTHLQAKQFFETLSVIAQSKEEEVLSNIIEAVYVRSGLKTFLKDKTEGGEERLENVSEFISSAKRFDHLPWREGLASMLEDVALVTDVDTGDSSDVVTLMTLHAAKGLEFDTVFFVGLEEGILPHSRSLYDPSELEEEIRLAYVGLTRARKNLYLIYTRARTIFGNTQMGIPSRILKVLPPESISTKNMSSLLSDDDFSYELTED